MIVIMLQASLRPAVAERIDHISDHAVRRYKYNIIKQDSAPEQQQIHFINILHHRLKMIIDIKTCKQKESQRSAANGTDDLHSHIITSEIAADRHIFLAFVFFICCHFGHKLDSFLA